MWEWFSKIGSGSAPRRSFRVRSYGRGEDTWWRLVVLVLLLRDFGREAIGYAVVGYLAIGLANLLFSEWQRWRYEQDREVNRETWKEAAEALGRGLNSAVTQNMTVADLIDEVSQQPPEQDNPQ